MLHRESHRGLGDESHPITEIGRHPGGGFAALFGADAGDNQVIDIPLAQPGVQTGFGQCIVHLFMNGDVCLMVEERQRFYPAGCQRKRPLR
ncbi:hypothetical protein D3C72_1572110 [compost metagenome]